MANISGCVSSNDTNCVTIELIRAAPTVFHTLPSLTYPIPDPDDVTWTKYETFHRGLVRLPSKMWLTYKYKFHENKISYEISLEQNCLFSENIE